MLGARPVHQVPRSRTVSSSSERGGTRGSLPEAFKMSKARPHVQVSVQAVRNRLGLDDEGV